MQQNKIILVGTFSEIEELCLDCGYQIFGYIDNQPSTTARGMYLGTDTDIDTIYSEYGMYPIVITPDQPIVRRKLYLQYKKAGFTIQTLISPISYVSKSAILDEGVIIQHGAHISANTRIGALVKVNVNANIMHDCVIHNFATIAPNAVVLGRVEIGKCAYIGANATVLPNCQVQNNAVVGAGAVVTRNVIENITVKGVPAK